MAKNELMERAQVYEVNGEEVKLSGSIVKQYLVRGNAEVSEQEIVMFLQLCKYQKLNPFLNEAYLVKFKGAPAQIITSKEAFMKRAESHPQYDGLEAGIIVDKGEELLDVEGAVLPPNTHIKGGWAKIYRKDRSRPISVRISSAEFSKGQATWKQMPLTMIRKTAIVNALREAFPEVLGAMYTEEESNDMTHVTPLDEVQQEIDENANQTTIDIAEELEVVDGEIVDEDIEVKQEELFDRAGKATQSEQVAPEY